MTNHAAGRYLQPGRADHTLNRVVGWLTRRGISLWGSRVLAVRGRSTGEWRTTPVNPLKLDGAWYLVAPRGEAQWARNLRVAGGGQLRLGGKVEEFTATELADEDKPPVLRAYLRRWKFEVARFFEGIDADAPDGELHRIAPGYPAFLITRR